MKNFKFLWASAMLITLLTAYYQRITGPGYPKKVTMELNGTAHSFKLPGSHAGYSDCKIEIPVSDTSLTGALTFKRYPMNEAWQSTPFTKTKHSLVAYLPKQLPAAKIVYYVTLEYPEQAEVFRSTEVIVRFRGDVPALFLIPHVLLMFLAMFYSTLSGLLAIYSHKKFKFYAHIGFYTLLAGGLILGPVVQLYAFGDLWTGVPFGWDLTDNKTLFSFIIWAVAIIGNRKKERKYMIIIAAIVLLIIFSIPHSMFGSELDYQSGKVIIRN